MSSSGLVVPPASSAARFGKSTWKVPAWLLVSSTWPEPVIREPFQAVRAVRVGMAVLSVGPAWDNSRGRQGFPGGCRKIPPVSPRLPAIAGVLALLCAAAAPSSADPAFVRGGSGFHSVLAYGQGQATSLTDLARNQADGT